MKHLQLAVALVCLMSTPALAESETEGWFEAEFQLEATDELQASVAQLVRWDQNFGRLHEVMWEFGGQYRIVEWFRVALGYRFILEQAAEGWTSGHRLAADSVVLQDVGPFELGYRMRLQLGLDSASNDLDLRPAWRHRLSAELEVWDGVRPFVQGEAFVRFADGESFRLAAGRFTTGLGFGIGSHAIAVYYRLQKVVAGDLTHIIGLDYTYELSLE